jgi:hypothetical protein
LLISRRAPPPVEGMMYTLPAGGSESPPGEPTQ